MPRDDAERRMALQATDEERRKVATWVVDNSRRPRRTSSARSTTIWPELVERAQEPPPEQPEPEHDCSCRSPSVPSDGAGIRARHRDGARGRPARGDRGARRGRRRRATSSRRCWASPGSGKSFTIANVIAQAQRPTLVLAPNKSLAAQLAAEFREFFPKNRVEYFVSYYDYYQPEAYIPSSDTYIEKDSSINDEIDRLRHSATSALLTRRDVIIVASVSAIYGLGSPEMYSKQLLMLNVGEERDQRSILRRLVELAVRAQRLRVRAQQVPGARRHDRGVPRLRGARGAHPALRRRGRAHLRGRPAHRRGHRGARLARAVPGVALHDRRGAPEGGDRRHRDRARPSGSPSSKASRSCSKRSACGCAPPTTSRCCARSAAARASRTTRCTSTGASATSRRTRCSTTSPTTGCACVDESHVAIPQLHGQFEGDRSRKETLVDARLPPAVGDGQPAAALRGVHRARQPGRVPVGHAGRVRARDLHADRRAGRAADRPHRSRSDREADEGPDRRPRRRDQPARRGRSARARHHAHEEDVGRPHRLPARARHPRALSALRDRHARAHRDPAVVAARRVRRARRHQPAAGGPRPARGRRWSRSSTPTRKASCARRRRSSRRPAAPRATSTVR